MRVITSIGEQGLSLPTGEFVLFRPSLYAMTQIGEPKEIVEVFAALHDNPAFAEAMPWETQVMHDQIDKINKSIMKNHFRHMLFLSWQVMYACATSDPKVFIGEPGERYGSYRFGKLAPEMMLVMARSLLRHGLIGPTVDSPQDGADQAEPEQRNGIVEFDALSFVSKAVTHLGVSEEEAWNMTITSFGSHWRAKYGENKDKRHSEEHDSTMRWLEKVNKMRAAGK